MPVLVSFAPVQYAPAVALVLTSYLDVCMIAAAVVADRCNARGLVACVSALVGSIGFIASAVLSPNAFNVSRSPSHTFRFLDRNDAC